MQQAMECPPISGEKTCFSFLSGIHSYCFGTEMNFQRHCVAKREEKKQLMITVVKLFISSIIH